MILDYCLNLWNKAGEKKALTGFYTSKFPANKLCEIKLPVFQKILTTIYAESDKTTIPPDTKTIQIPKQQSFLISGQLDLLTPIYQKTKDYEGGNHIHWHYNLSTKEKT